MADERILVLKHFQLYNDQWNSLNEFRGDIKERSVSPIIRKIIDNFLALPKEKQIKSIKG